MKDARKIRDQFQQVKKGDNFIHDSEIAGMQANCWHSKASPMVFAHSVIL